MKSWQVFGFISLIIIGVFWWNSNQSDPISVAEQQKPTDAIAESEWYLGNREAVVVIIEYSDLQCPACQFYSESGRQIVETFGEDNVGFAFRHFPLRRIHQTANLAAQAAEAAGLQDKFWEMESLLFANQDEWANSNQAFVLFSGYAQSLDLNIDQFRADIDSASVKAAVEADYLSGLVSQVESTPTFFINGQRVNNLRGPDDLLTRVQFALEEATVSGTMSGE